MRSFSTDTCVAPAQWPCMRATEHDGSGPPGGADTATEDPNVITPLAATAARSAEAALLVSVE